MSNYDLNNQYRRIGFIIAESLGHRVDEAIPLLAPLAAVGAGVARAGLAAGRLAGQGLAAGGRLAAKGAAKGAELAGRGAKAAGETTKGAVVGTAKTVARRKAVDKLKGGLDRLTGDEQEEL